MDRFQNVPKPLCHCLGVHADEIRACIDQLGVATVREVTRACGAGGGCTACHRHIKRLLMESAAEDRAQTEPVLGYA